MSGQLADWAMIAFIVIVISAHALRTARANPENTGSLGKKVNRLDGDVRGLRVSVDRVEAEVEDLKRTGATTKDIRLLEEVIKGHIEVAKRTEMKIDRLEGLILTKGLGK